MIRKEIWIDLINKSIAVAIDNGADRTLPLCRACGCSECPMDFGDCVYASLGETLVALGFARAMVEAGDFPLQEKR